jgi:hypothetical protein
MSGRRRIFYTKRNRCRGASRFRPCPSIVQYIYERCPAGDGTYFALFADYTCSYMAEQHERRVPWKLQRGLAAVNSWCEGWNVKINKGKTRAIYFIRRFRVHDDVLQLNVRDIPFANNATYLDVTFDRIMTWRHRIERTVAKTLLTCIRTYSLFRSGRLGKNIKLTTYRALTRSVTISGRLQRTLTSWNCRACRTVYSALLEILSGAQQSANCKWLSKFLTQDTDRSNPKHCTSKCAWYWTRRSH